MFRFCSKNSLKNFRGWNILFCYQGSTLLSLFSGNFDRISHLSMFVNNFLNFFWRSFCCCPIHLLRGGILSYHIFIVMSTIFLLIFRKKIIALTMEESGERGIWTLAPVARPTPLAGAPLRPLEYFSELCFPYWCAIRRVVYISKEFLSCQHLFLTFLFFFFIYVFCLILLSLIFLFHFVIVVFTNAISSIIDSVSSIYNVLTQHLVFLSLIIWLVIRHYGFSSFYIWFHIDPCGH